MSRLAALLSKFRIEYCDVIVIPDIAKKALESTKRDFENLIKPFKATETDGPGLKQSPTIKPDFQLYFSEEVCIRDSELKALMEKTNRHLRLRELLQKHSREATFVVM